LKEDRETATLVLKTQSAIQRNNATPEQISPELVLVDPELARWARAHLSHYEVGAVNDRQRDTETTSVAGRRVPAPPLSSPLAAGEDHEIATQITATQQPDVQPLPHENSGAREADPQGDGGVAVTGPDVVRPRGGTFAGARLAAFAAVCLGGFAATLAFTGSSPFREAVRGRVSQKERGYSNGTPQLAMPPAVAQRPKTRTKASKIPLGKKAAPLGKRVGFTRRRVRTFVWPHVRGAVSYDVQFFRRGRSIFATRTSRPRLTLPTHWQYGRIRYKLVPGQYRWYVWPLVRSGRSLQRAEPIIQARLVIPK
jgi:hypothetical protein